MPRLSRTWPTCLLLGWALSCTPKSPPPAAEFTVTPAPAEGAAAFGADGAEGGDVQLRYPASRRPWLGVEIEDQPSGQPGLRIVRVLRGSPAAVSQLHAGDTLLSVGGTRLDAPSDLVQALQSFGIGEEVPLSVQRGREHRLLRATLRGQPVFEDLLRLSFVGLEAPTISGVVTFQGEAASLSELRGKVVLLEFWASWCEVCRYLAPVLGRWQSAYRPAGLEVVGVTVDPPDVAARAATAAGMGYTLASDLGGAISESYLASQIPAVFVIDRRGVVVDVMVGVQAERLDEMHELVGRLLDQPAGERPRG